VIDSRRQRATRDERSEVIRVQNREHALPTLRVRLRAPLRAETHRFAKKLIIHLRTDEFPPRASGRALESALDRLDALRQLGNFFVEKLSVHNPKLPVNLRGCNGQLPTRTTSDVAAHTAFADGKSNAVRLEVGCWTLDVEAPLH